MNCPNPCALYIGWCFGFTAIGALMVGAAWLTVLGPHWPTL